LSYNFEQLFESGNNYDVLIQAGESPEIQEFRAHSIILSTRSPYFRAALSNNWARKQDGIIIFKKSNICPNIFKLLLKQVFIQILTF
ncbi:3742_t:CDS:1, partial [Dentiscutata heterogama]